MNRITQRYQKFISWYREPEQQKVVYKYRKWFWVLVLFCSVPTGWIYSTAFISALSIVALFIGDSSAEQAADAAIEQRKNS